MDSTSVSSTSTLPIDTGWANTVGCTILETCKEDRNFFQPEKQFDDKWTFKIFEKPRKPKPKRKKFKSNRESGNADDMVCYQKATERDLCVKNWAKGMIDKNMETLMGCCQTSEIQNDYKKLIISKFIYSSTPWYMAPQPPNCPDPPYLQHSFCYPKIMVNLGWNIMHNKKILSYVENGARLFLIDLRYGSKELHDKINENIRIVRNITAQNHPSEIIFGVAYQISGRALRTGLVYKNQKVFLDRDSSVILTADRRFSHKCNHVVIYVNFSDFIRRFQVDDLIKIGPRIRVKIKLIANESLHCIVVSDGLLESNMPIIVPITRCLDEPSKITKEEEDDVATAFRYECDFIICSCTYSPNVITHIHWVMATHQRSIGIFARVNMSHSMLQVQIDFIMKECHGIWFDGDGCDENAALRDYSVRLCFRKRKLIFRTALILNAGDPAPTDEEALKHFYLYPDCLVIDHRYDISKIRKNIRMNYADMNQYNFELSCGPLVRQEMNMNTVFCNNLIIAALTNKVSCIIMANNNGKSVFMVSQNRPMVPIIASFYDIRIARSMSVLRNVYPCVYWNAESNDWENQLQARLTYCIALGKSYGFINRDQYFLYCFDSRRGLLFSDTYRILKLDSF